MAEKDTSGANRPEKRNDALAALHGMGEDQHEEPPPQPAAPPNSSEGSATGFAAMLAHGPGPEPDLPPKPPQSSYNAALPTPKPRSSDDDRAARKSRGQEAIFEAREIRAPGTYAPPVPRGKNQKSSDSHKFFVPIMCTMGTMLFLIGLWAVGAAAHMDVPLAPTRGADGHYGRMWTVYVLLICLPIALLLYVLAFLMVRAAQRREAAAGQ